MCTALPGCSPSAQATAGRTVKTGVYENAPKIYTNADGKPAGLFIDLLQAIAAREGWRLEYVACTWAECLQSVTDGSLDLMPDVAYSEDRARIFDFHKTPAVNSWSQLYRNAGVELRSIADLQNRRVAVLNAAIQQTYLTQLMAGAGIQATFLPVSDYAAGFAAVRDGAADAVVANHFYGGRFAAGYGLVETPIMFNPVGLFFATGKGKNADLLAPIDRHLSDWRQEPDSIYFDILRAAMVPEPMTVVPRWLKAALLVTAGLGVLFGVFSVLLRWQVRRATAALQRTHRQLGQVLDASPVVLYSLRPEPGGYVTEWVSPNIERIFGFPAVQAQAPGWWESRLHPEDREVALANFERHALHGGELTQEYRILDAKGRTRYIHDELRVSAAGDGREGQIVGTWTDLTQAVRQAAELRFLTQYEPNTGLPNRARLHERLAKVLSHAGRQGAKVAVLLIDLDRFRYVNETLGHLKGDALLRAAARKIEALARIDDTLATVGGDEFVLVLGGETSAVHAAAVAEEVLRVFSHPIAPEYPHVVTASVGVSIFPDDAADADNLLKHAELALYEAKNHGRNCYRVFASELTTGVEARVRMESALRHAVDRKELVLHYQPQLALNCDEVAGVEALVRWNSAGFGFLHPGEFIPLAEESGLIHELGAWVLREACRQMQAWQAAGLDLGRVAVNLSVLQIEQQRLAEQVAGILRETGLAPERLELEVTESTIMRHPDKALATLRELKTLGVRLTIDDFGTGHSSLAVLKRLPFNRVKIDQAFVREIGRDANDEAICRTVIELGRNLGLETVAEGVEREEQAAFLRAEGCGFAQGFLFGRPLSADVLQLAWGKRVAATKGAPA